jgi:hypothetical protein
MDLDLIRQHAIYDAFCLFGLDKIAAMPPPIPSHIRALSNLQNVARQGVPGAAQAAAHLKPLNASLRKPFQSAFTPDVLAKLKGGI